MHRRHLLMTAAAAAVAVTLPRPARAAPEADLWPRWQANDPQSTARIDHGAWARFLDRYLLARPDAVNLLDYAAVTPADRDALKRHLEAMSQVRISDYARDEQFAYWANLYNALTVEVILDHWPVETILDVDISPGLFSDGPWGAELIAVEGTALTLDDIEHRILRPIWQDNRIHYAVNCASLGCPDLRPEPLRADRLDLQLNAAARAYVNHPRGATVQDGKLIVSSIYHWYQEDFGDSDAGVIAHLKRYAGPDLKAALEGVSEIADHRYDWAINAPETKSG